MMDDDDRDDDNDDDDDVVAAILSLPEPSSASPTGQRTTGNHRTMRPTRTGASRCCCIYRPRDTTGNPAYCDSRAARRGSSLGCAKSSPSSTGTSHWTGRGWSCSVTPAGSPRRSSLAALAADDHILALRCPVLPWRAGCHSTVLR